VLESERSGHWLSGLSLQNPSGWITKYWDSEVGRSLCSLKLGLGLQYAGAVRFSYEELQETAESRATFLFLSPLFLFLIHPNAAQKAIPNKLESTDAAPMLCAGLTSYSALRKYGAKSGQ
jgi:hypothetical protein